MNEGDSKRRIDDLIDLYQRATGSTSSGNSITVSVNAGGVGVWIATTACLVMLACGMVGAFWITNEFRQYDAHLSELRSRDRVHDAYIQAAYRGDKKPEGK
jgi:hypothetical protein